MDTLSARNIPNGLTLLRIVLLPPLVWFFYSQRYTLALGCFLVIGFSDFLDGYLARRFGWLSRLGSILDPVADKLVMLISYYMLWDSGLIPLWLLLVVLGRDLLIVTGSGLCRLFLGPYEMQPTLLSKLNTLLQLVLVVAILCHLSVFALPDSMRTLLILGVGSLSVVSGLQYVWIWGAKVLSERS